MDLEQDIRFLKGVGEKRALLLNKIGIYKIRDLIEYFPRNYENRNGIKKISQFENGMPALFIATISSRLNVRYIRKNLTIYSCLANDEEGNICKLTWFNQKYIRTRIKENTKYIFYGKAEYENNMYNIDSPSVYSVSELEEVKGIFPVYPLTYGITNNYIFKLVKEVFKENFIFSDIFDKDFNNKYNLTDINDAVRKIHFPKELNDISIARKRLIFEELFLLQLSLRMLKSNKKTQTKQNVFKDLDTSEFEKLLPFTLTKAQSKVVDEIKQDLKSEYVVNRMIQGDVGCGKTMVAALACFVAIKNGYQASIMAPTAILASQHYEELSKYFNKLDINVELITSSNTKKQKQDIANRLKEGKIDLLIGTHAILEDNIEFKNLGLVVTDEQHRFGVNQRIKLVNKGKEVETIVMSATPIPRSLALMLYGDLDLSIIDELPNGRIPIKTCVATKSQQGRVNDFITKQINLGRQVYVVCPLVEDSETLELNSVESVYEQYSKEYFKEYKVEFIHGKMPSKRKDEIMQQFKNKEIDILISTSVIEVGISVPNATLMVIEDADRFGLASLHQLRGRVGRGNLESYCILKTNNNSITSKERLKIMEKSNNGFEIAEKDLELRGPGDFFGVRQSGLPELKIADLIKDIKILELSKKAVSEILQKDPNLQLEENKKIKEKLYNIYHEQLKNIGM